MCFRVSNWQSWESAALCAPLIWNDWRCEPANLSSWFLSGRSHIFYERESEGMRRNVSFGVSPTEFSKLFLFLCVCGCLWSWKRKRALGPLNQEGS